jgi:hypothetical protein
MSSFITPVRHASPYSHRIDGVDVSHLLRDIGEAAACTDPVELFRLCLAAQRALLAGAGGDGAGQRLSIDEADLLSLYRSMDAEARVDATLALQGLARLFPRCRPAPALIQTGQHIGGGAA